MDASTIQAVGQYIVLPICIAVGFIAYIYFLTK